jgi:thiamine kinase-like enzyme
VVEDCTIEAGHYGRQHRCVLRYEVDGRWVDAEQNTLRRERQVIYGKVAADDRSKVVGMVLNALHWHMERVRSRRRFVLPPIVGYRPNSRLILLAAIPGAPRIPQLIQAEIEGTANRRPGALTLEQAVQDCAQVAVALHKTAIRLDKPRTFADEVAYLQGYLPAAQEFSLALAMQLQHGLRRLQSYADQTPPLPLCLIHGDFTYTQLLFDEESCGLVDFDTICQAEPALDLGQFLAYLRLAARKAQQGKSTGAALAVDELGEQFINTYSEAAGYSTALTQQLRQRVAAYEIISLMRIALHSWQKLKGNRLELVIELIEERIECLPKIVHETPIPQQQPRKAGQPRKAAPRRLATPVSPSPAGLPQP